MYLVIDSEKRIAEICEHPCYVRRQKNGVVILSDLEHADAIYSNDSNSFYPTEKIGYLCESHVLIEVESVPENVVAGFYFYHAGEFYTTEENLTALAKSKAPEVAGLVFVKMAESEQLDDVRITEHAEQFPAWGDAISYTANAICKYDGKLFRCLQAHTSQADWTPDTAASLWRPIGNPFEEWPEWSQPVGAADAYALGDKVTHGGKRYVSAVDNNVWEPGAPGVGENIWSEVV